MTTRGEKFAGLTVALVTPFRNGEIDYDDLGKLVDWHAEQGTDCLSPVGTTGGGRSTSAMLRNRGSKSQGQVLRAEKRGGGSVRSAIR